MKRLLSYSALYALLRNRFGHLGWWPGDTPDEIVIGALLTQRTSWKNVEIALKNLKSADAVDLRKVGTMNLLRLEALLKPSGFYRQKARRIKALSAHIFGNYRSLDEFLSMDKDALRKELLGMDGIGKETADAIMLYAAGKPVFIVDAYTIRIMGRVYGTGTGIEYDRLAAKIEGSIKKDLDLYKDFHAQFVELGKAHCKPRPQCQGCPINEHCAYFISLTKDR